MEQARDMMTPFRVESERQVMQTPEAVSAILELHRLGWGAKRIARELKVDKNTVKRYLRAGGWTPYRRPGRGKSLDGKLDWIHDQFRVHGGNADVVRQELKRRFDIQVSLRTVERAVQPVRRQLRAAAVATVRFETAPGKQMQADFGQTRVMVGGQPLAVHLCVITLSYSRRPFVAPFTHERQGNWMLGMEGAFLHFNGLTEEMLIDNARMLVKSHDIQTREVVFTTAFREFAKYWGFRPRACAPFRARTKGKDESGVGYVKRNAIAGRQFESWEALCGHLQWWMREIADVRVHGTTGERPIDRFLKEEAAALHSIDGRASFVQAREMVRNVHADLCVEVETNHYSVPWRYIGEQVSVQLVAQQVRIVYAGNEIARHAECRERRQWIVDPRHFEGLVGAAYAKLPHEGSLIALRRTSSELARPLSEYEAVVGGR